MTRKEQRERDEHETPVLFRVHRADVTAVFPCEPADIGGKYVSCYAHVGQHGSCSLAWYHDTRPATEAEYADLKAELEGAPYGYRLKVYRRMTRQHHVAFQAEVRRLRGCVSPR